MSTTESVTLKDGILCISIQLNFKTHAFVILQDLARLQQDVIDQA